MARTSVREASVHDTIDILLVGGYPIYREGLRILLDREPGFRVVGDASDPEEALKAIADVKPDIVIVNLSDRPLVHMMHALRNPIAGGAHARMILLTTRQRTADIVQAHALGFSAVVATEGSPQMLLESVRCVAADDDWRAIPASQFPPAVAVHAVESLPS